MLLCIEMLSKLMLLIMVCKMMVEVMLS